MPVTLHTDGNRLHTNIFGCPQEDTKRSSCIKKVALGSIGSIGCFASAVAYTAFSPIAGAVIFSGSLFMMYSLFASRVGYTHVNIPKVDMRESPSSFSKVVSQAVLGEKIVVEKTNTNWWPPTWSYVRTSDGYTGWVPTASLTCMKEESAKESVRVSAIGGGYLYSEKDTEFGPELIVPYGSSVRILDNTDVRWAQVALPDGSKYYIQKGDIAQQAPIRTKKDLIDFSCSFLGKHYAWGGKSGDEFDCSGFVQELCRAMNKSLPRDSKDQIQDPQLKKIAEDVVDAGDLVFFGSDPKKIRHVGMCLGNNKFIHATVAEQQPWVRISHLQDTEWNGMSPSRPYRTFRRFIRPVA